MSRPKAETRAAGLIDAAKATRISALQAQVTRLKASQAELLRELQTADERLGVVAELAESTRPLRPLLTAPIKGHGKGSRRTATAVADASDWHVEERVDPATIDGLNDYSPTVSRRRAGRFFEGVEWLIRSETRFQIADLLLRLGGDLITGYIHEELLEGNFLSPTEAVLFAQELLSDGIRFLLKSELGLNLNVVCDFGNHGRTTIKPRVATAAKNSFEWLLYHMLAAEFRAEPRVQFVIAEGHHQVSKIGNFRLHTTHGDKIKANGGIGGIDVPINRAIAQWHQTMPADCTMIGHFHRYQPGERVHTNGSLIGYAPFSRDIVRAPYAPPVQSFFLIDSLRGKTQCAPIWVEDAKFLPPGKGRLP